MPTTDTTDPKAIARRLDALERDGHARATGFTDEQIAQIRAAFREELADAGLRLDDATHQDEAREDFRFLRRLRISWDGAVNQVGNAVLLAIIAVGGTIVGLGFWAWLAGSLQK
jgi:hypothetical protein